MLRPFSQCNLDAYLAPHQTFMLERFCRNSQQLKAGNYFRKKAPSKMFDGKHFTIDVWRALKCLCKLHHFSTSQENISWANFSLTWVLPETSIKITVQCKFWLPFDWKSFSSINSKPLIMSPSFFKVLLRFVFSFCSVLYIINWMKFYLLWFFVILKHTVT